MRKVKCTRGETLVETLVSLLIIMFAILFLTGSVVTAARSNAKMKTLDNSLHYGGTPVSGTVTLSDDDGTTEDVEITVDIFTDNDYVYYFKSNETA